MSEHYYTSRPSSESDKRKIDITLRGQTLYFYTDHSVFSKSSVDFGSRLLIETMELPETGRLLDVGCGYGPIGLFASSINRSLDITMVDINERAVELAKENAQLNQLNQKISVLQSDGLGSLDEAKFDIILCNPPIRTGKNVVYRLFEEAAQSLTKEGHFWIVIRKQQGADSAIKKLETLFSEVEVRERKKGFYIIESKIPR